MPQERLDGHVDRFRHVYPCVWLRVPHDPYLTDVVRLQSFFEEVGERQVVARGGEDGRHCGFSCRHVVGVAESEAAIQCARGIHRDKYVGLVPPDRARDFLPQLQRRFEICVRVVEEDDVRESEHFRGGHLLSSPDLRQLS